MKDLTHRAREVARSRRDRAVRPIFDPLEDRMLLYSVNGDTFVYSSRITWSIMPDGTSLGGISSNFVSTMNQKLGSGNWISAISDAFAQWENVANVNFVQVSDNGEAFGAGNYQQGDPNVGDIRIGGFTQGSNILAFTMLPPKANGGSDAGDVLFNTNQPWHIGSDYDLETVMLHEIGHDVGLGESSNINAVMYPYYGGVEQSPNTDDINGVQAVLGPRQEDPFVQSTDNLTAARAANVTSFMNTSSDQVYLPGLDVASSAENYWFKVTTPANASNVFTAQVQSTSLSELSPRVVIYNSSLQGLVQTVAPANAYGTTINATITNATPNTTYYIRVLGSNTGSTGTGAYAMTINMGYGYIGTAPPPNTTVAAQPDQGGGNETMIAGGFGGWFKEWLRSGGANDLSMLGIQNDPSLSALVQQVANDLANSNSINSSIFEVALVVVLQEIPSGVMDGSSLGSGQSGGSGTISTDRLEKILTRFFTDLDWILTH